MDVKYIKSLISQGEGINIEFKKSHSGLNKDLFDSICAFLNRHGGHIFLGVNDDGKITGVDEKKIPEILNSFVTTANNPQKLYPSFYFSPEIIEIEGKKILYILIPESSQVHKTKSRIYDRSEDGDIDVTNNSAHISQLYLRKQTAYSENTIFPFVTLSDLRSDLIEKVRVMAKNENAGFHPWFEMSDEEFLRSAQLYKKDLMTGKEGFTSGAILLFGKDKTILSAVPHHRTDAVLRIKNMDRYDDRDDIRTNLIDSYERLMSFVVKHLPDPFYIENDVRISLRNRIFREAITNILIHREFVNAFPAKMIIEKNKVVFENGNTPHGHGMIDPDKFTPFPKNPVIARVFKEIGYADELGSGVKNLYKYCRIYSGGNPELIEDDIFKIVIPLTSATE